MNDSKCIAVCTAILLGIGIASWIATASLPHLSEGFLSPN